MPKKYAHLLRPSDRTADGGRWKTALKSFAVKSRQVGPVNVALALAGPAAPRNASASAAVATAAARRFTIVGPPSPTMASPGDSVCPNGPLQARNVTSRVQYRPISERTAQEKENQRRAQASKVAAWFEVRATIPGKGGSALEWGAYIRNASDLPILDVTTAFHLVEDPGNGQPWEPVYVADLIRPIRVILPAAERFVMLNDNLRTQEKIGSDDYVVGIGFTDAAGNRWQRDPRGALKDGTSYGVRWMEVTERDDLGSDLPSP